MRLSSIVLYQSRVLGKPVGSPAKESSPIEDSVATLCTSLPYFTFQPTAVRGKLTSVGICCFGCLSRMVLAVHRSNQLLKGLFSFFLFFSLKTAVASPWLRFKMIVGPLPPSFWGSCTIYLYWFGHAS